ncbi:hypothetical protein [Aeromicrobium sp. UC242_57]|uniref:hypothetical protein n=1 Tax=Aeromicrobium sp. UC242_57 TaxID=3374624 RepID=UPI0037AFA76B
MAVLAVSYGRGGYAGPYSGKAGLFFEADDIDLRSNDSWKALKSPFLRLDVGRHQLPVG